MSERGDLEIDLERELKRDDRIGQRERRAAVKGQLMLLDTIDELCRDSLDNYRYLEHCLDDNAEGDELDSLEETAPDAPTLEVLINALYAGDLKGELIFTSRLQYTILPELKKFWDHYLRDQTLYTPLTYKDDINRRGLEGFQIEAKCSLCGQTFVPLPESFIGFNAEQMGLYEHYQKMTDAGEKDCGGLGLITGGYKGMEHKVV